jgi:hypothetical protein
MIASLAALAFLTASAAAGDCEQAVRPAELEAAITDAEQAAGRNAELFAAAVGFTTRELPCIEHVLEPAQAARLHRVLGLQALVQGQRDQALSSFAASHRIEPDYRFSTEVFPPSHPIARLYAEASTPTTDSEPAPWSVGTVSWYDGTKAQLRPSSSATILQRGAPEGERVWTHYLMPDQPLPPTPLVAYAEEHRAQPGGGPPARSFQRRSSPLGQAGPGGDRRGRGRRRSREPGGRRQCGRRLPRQRAQPGRAGQPQGPQQPPRLHRRGAGGGRPGGGCERGRDMVITGSCR